MMHFFRNISFRITTIYAALFFVGLISVTTATMVYVNFYINQQSNQQLEVVSAAIEDSVHSASDFNTINLYNIAQMNHNIDIVLRDGTGQIYSSDEENRFSQIFTAPLGKMMSKNIAGKDFLTYNSRLILDNNQNFTLQIIKDPSSDNAFLKALFWIMLYIDSISLVLSFFIGFILSKRALTPIDNIIMQAKNFSASNLKNRIVIDGPDDEIKKLANTFNELIERIEHSYEKQNRFALDASHELATPLAVIKGYVDLIDRWGKDDREVLNEGIAAIKKETQSMTKLLDTLLILAKSDNDLFKIEKSIFDLDEMMAEVVMETKIVAPDHMIALGKNDPVRIYADQRLIKQMVRALIDNSIKYSGSHGSIVIQVKKTRDHASISILDNGIGIPQKELPYIFDRFYRVDKARSRLLGGAGLGLSFVKWIVNMHEGNISVRSKPKGITRFDILLPLPKDIVPTLPKT